jgi:DNA-binding NtrC family response regulator
MLRARGELQEIERQRISGALEQCGGNQTRAAEALGISRRTLVSRLGELGVPRPRKR